MNKFTDEISENKDLLKFYQGDRNSEKIAIVIHGIKLNNFWKQDISNSVKHLVEFLKNNYKAVAIFKYNCTKFGSISTENLNKIIIKINKNSVLDFYGHSKGGVIALLYVLKYKNQSRIINRVVQICCPNNGTTNLLLKYIPIIYHLNHSTFGPDYISYVLRKILFGFIPGYMELIFHNNRKSICHILNLYISNLNENIEFISISSSEDNLVTFESASLPFRDNVLNIHFTIKDKTIKENYGHSEIIDNLNINGLKNILQKTLDDTICKDSYNRIIHISENCQYVNISSEELPKNVFEICNHCLEEISV